MSIRNSLIKRIVRLLASDVAFNEGEIKTLVHTWRWLASPQQQLLVIQEDSAMAKLESRIIDHLQH